MPWGIQLPLSLQVAKPFASQARLLRARSLGGLCLWTSDASFTRPPYLLSVIYANMTQMLAPSPTSRDADTGTFSIDKLKETGANLTRQHMPMISNRDVGRLALISRPLV